MNVFTVLHAELFTLTYKDKTGEAYEIKVSGEHPFWVADKGWVAARQLAINDRLEITDNTYVAVTGLTSEPAKLGETFTTYNFEVDDFHTYFVLQEGKTNGAFAVLVHNANWCGDFFYKGIGFQKAIDHIWDLHSFANKMPMAKSYFLSKYSTKSRIKKLVTFARKQAKLQHNSGVISDGRRIITIDMKNYIGFDLKGRKTKTITIIEMDGRINNAFPGGVIK